MATDVIREKPGRKGNWEVFCAWSEQSLFKRVGNTWFTSRSLVVMHESCAQSLLKHFQFRPHIFVRNAWRRFEFKASHTGCECKKDAQAHKSQVRHASATCVGAWIAASLNSCALLRQWRRSNWSVRDACQNISFHTWAARNFSTTLFLHRTRHSTFGSGCAVSLWHSGLRDSRIVSALKRTLHRSHGLHVRCKVDCRLISLRCTFKVYSFSRRYHFSRVWSKMEMLAYGGCWGVLQRSVLRAFLHHLHYRCV